MTQITTGSVRKWVSLTMSLVLVVSLITWYWQRKTLPNRVRIATGSGQGLYFKVGSTIGDSLEKRIASSIEVVETDGARQNYDLLQSGDAEFAIVQGGSPDRQDSNQNAFATIRNLRLAL